MKSCSRCGQEIPTTGSKFCPNCGNELEGNISPGSGADETADLEFEVTEAADDSRHLVGQDPVIENEPDDLGIMPPIDQATETSARHQPETVSPPPLGSPPLESLSASAPEPSGSTPDEELPILSPDSPFNSDELSEASRQQLERLSEEEIQQINQQMYAKAQVPDPSKSALTDKQKQELVDKLKGIDRPFGNEPIKPGTTPPPPQSNENANHETRPTAGARPAAKHHKSRSVKMATHGQGTAFFWRNYIQIMSNQALKSEETITIGNRIYSLKPKVLNKPLLIGGGSAVVALLLIFIAVAIFSQGGSGTGKIFGIALNAYDQPYVQSAIIRFPELGNEIRSDSQGFFAVDQLNTGTYKIEYIVGSQVLKTDYATVVDGKITTVTLRPEYELTDAAAEQELSEASDEAQSQVADKSESSSSTRSATKSSGRKRAPSRPGSVVLSANVKNARLIIDGEVLGAGNLTYNGIKAGERRWEVSADGYHPSNGTLKLASGGQETIEVELEPVVKEKSPKDRALDFLLSGKDALKEGDFVRASQQLNKAIKLDPGMAEAYFQLGEASRYANDHQAAYDYYLRAAEMYRFRQKRNAALTAFNRAIEVSGKRTDAYIGRAALYLDNGSVQIAIADLETAEDIDNNNPQVHYGLGEAYYTLGDYKKACKYFDKARKLSPDDPLPYQALMLSYTAREDHKKVRKLHEEFMEVASEQDVERFRTDEAFSSVWRVVDSE